MSSASWIDAAGGGEDQHAGALAPPSCPRRMLAAAARSSRRPLVQEPMTIWSTFVPATSATGLTLSTVCGQAIWGSSAGDVDLDRLLVRGVGVGVDELDLVGRPPPPRAGSGRSRRRRGRRRRWRRPPPSCCRAPGGRRSDMARMVSPWNSITRKLAPLAVSRPTRWRIRSLGPTPSGNSPADVDLDGAGHLDVEGHAEGPDAGHLGGADAEGEGAQGAVAGGVGVGAHDHRAGADVAVLGQDLVADPALVSADVVEAGDALLGHELPDLLLVAWRSWATPPGPGGRR